MWIKTSLGAEVKVRRDAFVIYFVEREFTNSPGHALAARREKRCCTERKRVGKVGIPWMFSSGRLGLCLLGHQGWQGLRLDQVPSSADRRENLPGQKLSEKGERFIHSKLHPRDKLCAHHPGCEKQSCLLLRILHVWLRQIWQGINRIY